MKILLDTHTFLWWCSDFSKLPAHLLQQLQSPQNECLLSVVSSWEVLIKTGLGKLTLADRWDTIVHKEVTQNAFTILPIHLKHTFLLQKLPPLHRDPFDRMLIAQAMSENLTIASKDKFIRQYSDVQTIWD